MNRAEVLAHVQRAKQKMRVRIALVTWFGRNEIAAAGACDGARARGRRLREERGLARARGPHRGAARGARAELATADADASGHGGRRVLTRTPEEVPDVRTIMSTKTYGQNGYEAYAAQTGGKTWDGRSMPQWHELPPNIVSAWEAAATSIISAYDPPAKPETVDKTKATEAPSDGVVKTPVEAKADGTTTELVDDDAESETLRNT